MKKLIIIIIIVVPISIYSLLGVFIVQPIGAVPEGSTVVYYRVGTNLPFLTSADGWLIDQEREVSLFARAMAISTIINSIGDKKIFSLPYFESLYLLTTGGRKFSK